MPLVRISAPSVTPPAAPHMRPTVSPPHPALKNHHPEAKSDRSHDPIRQKNKSKTCTACAHSARNATDIISMVQIPINTTRVIIQITLFYTAATAKTQVMAARGMKWERRIATTNKYSPHNITITITNTSNTFISCGHFASGGYKRSRRRKNKFIYTYIGTNAPSSPAIRRLADWMMTPQKIFVFTLREDSTKIQFLGNSLPDLFRAPSFTTETRLPNIQVKNRK